LYGGFDPMAKTAHVLLTREFEYKFVIVPWSMTASLLLFIAVVMVRLVLEFDLLNDPARKDTAGFVLLSVVSLMAHLLSYINSTLCLADSWSNLGGMTMDVIRLILMKCYDKPMSMRVLSIAAAGGAMHFGLIFCS
jgi:hypothetical protein